MSRLPQPRFHATIEITDSGALHSCQYDPKREILDLTMKNGKRYRYRDVANSVFADLVTTKSPGKVYNRFIKGNGSVKLQPYQARHW